MEKQKHWRDVYKSDYLASWDLDKDEIVTIRECKEEMCKLQKKELKVVAYFSESELPNGVKLKPMILNPTNCKFLQTKTGNKFFSEWKNLKVQLSVVENKGGIGEKNGLRITNIFNEIDWTEITELLKLKEDSLSEDERTRAYKIIDNKDTVSHQKLLNFLKSK
jgi:hypothetical protein